MRFPSLQRFNNRSPQSRVCLARYVPLSGFFNLSAGYSSSRPEVLFHTSNARGISPSRVFPSRTACCLVGNNYPLSITATQPAASCRMSLLSTDAPRNDYRQRGIAYRVLLRSRVRSHPSLVLPRQGGRYSLRLLAFQGTSPAGTSDSEETLPLSCLLSLSPGADAVQSVGNLRTRISPEREIQPS
jgi:hypothetical protein